MFLEISQSLQEKTYEFFEISKNTFFYNTPLVAASVNWKEYDDFVNFANDALFLIFFLVYDNWVNRLRFC